MRVAVVTVIVALVGGLGTWLVAPANTVHIGASGIVFGYAAYLVARGAYSRSLLQIGLGLVVLVVWGTTLLRGLVPEDGISWQGHLFGAVGGVIAARMLHRRAVAQGRRRAGGPAAHADLTVRDGFPEGAAVTLAALEADPAPVLARLREREPVSWVPALDGWLVTRRDLAMQVMRDAETFTVDDPRFSTGQVVGPSMLTLDGPEHRRHRAPFAGPFRLDAVRERFTGPVREETDRLLDAIAPAGEAELRRELAGPLATAAVTLALGLRGDRDRRGARLVRRDRRLGHRDHGRRRADRGRPARVRGAPRRHGARDGARAGDLARGRGGGRRRRAGAPAQVVSNAAVLLFGGIETTEGMIANAIAHLLAHPDQLAAVRAEPALLANAIEESLRLEPAAAVIDRYATRAVGAGRRADRRAASW